MKTSTSILLATATAVAVSAARIAQKARHQRQRNEALLASNQLDWLTQMPTNPDLVKLWGPKDIEAEEYMQLMSANRLICTLSLRDRLGFVPKGHLPFFAARIMESDASRRY